MPTTLCLTPRPPASGSRITAVVGLSLVAVILAGCSGDEDPVASASSTSTTSPAGTASASTAGPGPGASPGATTPNGVPSTAAPGDPSPTGSEPATSTPGGPVVAPSVTSTADRSVPPPAGVVTVISIAASEDGAVEKLVLTTEGGVPGCTVRYVDAVRVDDEPVLTDGPVALELVLQAADPTGEQGLAPGVSTELYPDQALLQDVRLAEYLGDRVTFAVGLNREVPFTVTTTSTTVTVTFYG